MSVRSLAWDCSDEVGQDVDNPSWENVEAEILRMDGQRYTAVGMILDDHHNMMIGGGGEHYTLGICDANNGVSYLKNINGSPDKDIWINAGQGSDYPEEIVVALPDVLKAARYYFEHNKADPRLQWTDW